MKNNQARMISFAIIAVAGSLLCLSATRGSEASILLAIGFLGFGYEVYRSHWND